jgi:hypothetical protein
MGWEAATHVEQLVQEECSGSPYGSPDGGGPPAETFELRAGEHRFVLVYHDAHFRCAQDVEAFFRTSSGAADVLVQPVDMNPDSVAGCDCLYDLTMAIEPVETGTVQVTLFRRWDRMNDDVSPVLIGSQSVGVN